MSGAMFTLDIDGVKEFEEVAARLNKLSHLLDDPGELLESVGAEVESQIRRRLAHEMEGPDGEEWPEWSDAYAKTRHGGHSLLENEGDLIDSLQHLVGGGVAEVGTNIVYGAIQHFGSEEVDSGIPARPFIGLSGENRQDVTAVINDWLDYEIQRAVSV